MVPHLPAGQPPAAGVSAKLLDEDGQEGDSGGRGRRGSGQQGPDMEAMFDDVKVSATAFSFQGTLENGLLIQFSYVVESKTITHNNAHGYFVLM